MAAGSSEAPKLVFDLEDKRVVKERNSSDSLLDKEKLVVERFNKFILELEELFKNPGATDPDVLAKLSKFRNEKFIDIFNNDPDFNDFNMDERLFIYKYWLRNSKYVNVSSIWNLHPIG